MVSIPSLCDDCGTQLIWQRAEQCPGHDPMTGESVCYLCLSSRQVASSSTPTSPSNFSSLKGNRNDNLCLNEGECKSLFHRQVDYAPALYLRVQKDHLSVIPTQPSTNSKHSTQQSTLLLSSISGQSSKKKDVKKGFLFVDLSQLKVIPLKEDDVRCQDTQRYVPLDQGAKVMRSHLAYLLTTSMLPHSSFHKLTESSSSSSSSSSSLSSSSSSSSPSSPTSPTSPTSIPLGESMLDIVVTMDKTVKILETKREEMKGYLTSLRKHLSLWKSKKGKNAQEKHCQQVVIYQLNELERVYVNMLEHAMNVVFMEWEKMIRVRRQIVGTLSYVMQYLGVWEEARMGCEGWKGVRENDASRKERINSLLEKREVNEVNEELLMMKALIGFRWTFEEGDVPLLVALTEEDVELILNQDHGFKLLLTLVKTFQDKHDVMMTSVQPRTTFLPLLNELKSQIISVSQAFLSNQEKEIWSQALHFERKRQYQRSQSCLSTYHMFDAKEAYERALPFVICSPDYPQCPSLHSLKLVDAAYRAGSKDALMLKALLQPRRVDCLRLLNEALRQGATDPLIYYYLGEYTKDAGNREEFKKTTLDYFNKAIEGGCSLGHVGLAHNIAKGFSGNYDSPASREAAINYLETLIEQKQGDVDGCIFIGLADLYVYSCNTTIPQEVAMSRAIDYLHRAARLGYTQWYWSLYYSALYTIPCEKALIGLLDVEYSGVNCPTLLEEILRCILLSRPDHNRDQAIIESYGGKAAMMHLYADKLISLGRPEGYRWKYAAYKKHSHDPERANKVFKEACELGLASAELYCDVARYYFEKRRDGDKILEYCTKCLELTNNYLHHFHCYSYLAGLYEEGIPPIARDLKKANKLNAACKRLDEKDFCI